MLGVARCQVPWRLRVAFMERSDTLGIAYSCEVCFSDIWTTATRKRGRKLGQFALCYRPAFWMTEFFPIKSAMDYSLLWANRVLISIFHLLLNWNRNHWARGPLRMVSWGSRTVLSALPPWLKETGSQKHSIGCPLSALFTPPSSPKAHTEHRQGFESNPVLTSIRIGNEAWNSTAISNSSSPWPVSGNRVDHSTCCFTCDNDSWASEEAEASFDLFITLSDLESNSHNDCRWLLGSRTLSGLLLGGILKHLFAMVSP